jgi:hypothetical protein
LKDKHEAQADRIASAEEKVLSGRYVRDGRLMEMLDSIGRP